MWKRASQLTPEDLRSITIEEYLAYVDAGDNQVQDLGNADINIQPDSSLETLNDILQDIQPHQTQRHVGDNQLQCLGNVDTSLQLDNSLETLNDVFHGIQPHQTQRQVQEPQNVTSFPNINNQNFSQQCNFGEMTFEESLIGLGLVQAPPQVSYPQQVIQHHNGVVHDTNKSVFSHVTAASLGSHWSTITSVPVMVPLWMSCSGTNKTTGLTSSRATNARRRRRMRMLKLRENRKKDISHRSTTTDVPAMVPLGMSSSGTNQTTGLATSMATKARQHRRMCLLKQRKNRMKDRNRGGKQA